MCRSTSKRILEFQEQARDRKVKKDCYIGEIDLSNKQIGAVIQKEWGISVVPTVIIFREGKEVKRFVPDISLKFDEEEVLGKIKTYIR